jgi:hypothetical protein
MLKQDCLYSDEATGTVAERSNFAVPIRFQSRDGVARRDEPTTFGLPWPRGVARSADQFWLVSNGLREPLQASVLDRWADGSIRWCLYDLLATTDAASEIRVGPTDEASPQEVDGSAKVENGTITAQAGRGAALFSARPIGMVEWSEVAVQIVVAQDGTPDQVVNPDFKSRWIERGPVRWRATFESEPLSDGLIAFGHVDVFARSPVARVQFTLRNTRPAGHPGGNWDLGNAGSVFLRDVALSVRLPGIGPIRVGFSAELGQPVEFVERPVELYQDSSGGENWRSRNHLNRHRVVPHRFRGYELTSGERKRNGFRATPVVIAERGDRMVGMAMNHFWENFPKALEANADGVVLRLFPRQSSDIHELQGGEQKTHVFHIAFGHDAVTEVPLDWCRNPLLAHADPEWYSRTEAVFHLTPKRADPNADYLALVDQAIEGLDTFVHKREKIDEYGWRHFGDVYADHEAAFHTGPEPLVSHYNNQFDVVFGCGIQFLRSGNARWWDLFLPAADHTCDVDIYHTDGDKAAYNNGLFWPTFHYNDADTGTHRTYPKSLRSNDAVIPGRSLQSMGATGAAIHGFYAAGFGGGPSASHNYNRGLMLAYYLTGNPVYRDTAVDLARFVVAMDAPRTLLRLLSSEHTGLATGSGGDYHGPGRASGNSILALVVGHRLTGDRSLLDKAEQLIRRSSHPEQDLESLDLLNAELRWFYTMHLQALGEYLDHKSDLGEFDRMYDYARGTLLHYARWMANRERPILDHPDRLQYPTETWAAQELRKVEVFQHAAKHAIAEERNRLLERAEWFFRYVERTLTAFPTRSYCRPMVLLMNFGWSRSWWLIQLRTENQDGRFELLPQFDRHVGFVPQKTIVKQRAKAIVLAVLGFVLLSIGYLVFHNLF